MSFNLTLIAQMLAFLAFIGFTAKFVWPPLMRAIEARQKNIADGLAAADPGRRSLEQSTKAAEDALNQARGRAASGRSSTQADATNISAKPMRSAGVGRSPRISIDEITPTTGEASTPSEAVVAGSRRTMSNQRK